MLRQLCSIVPSGFRLGTQGAPAVLVSRGFKAVADVEIDFTNRETLKKYVGIRDHLSKEPGTKGKLLEALKELVDAIKVVPEDSDYRKAVEATAAYRVKVCKENEAEPAIEEVLDAHMEELIKEAREEIRLIPLMAGGWLWLCEWWVGRGRTGVGKSRQALCCHARTQAGR